MSAPMHELPPVDLSQIDDGLGGPEPYVVGIAEGPQFGQDPVALLEAGPMEPSAPSLASRVGDRMSQIGGAVSEVAQTVGEKLSDPRFQKMALAAGQGALIGVGLANRAEDGSLEIDTAGVATTVRRVVKNPTPMGIAKMGAQAAWGAGKEVQRARAVLDAAYEQPR